MRDYHCNREFRSRRNLRDVNGVLKRFKLYSHSPTSIFAALVYTVRMSELRDDSYSVPSSFNYKTRVSNTEVLASNAHLLMFIQKYRLAEALGEARDASTFTSQPAFAQSTDSTAWQYMFAVTPSRHPSLLFSLTNHLDQRDQNLARAIYHRLPYTPILPTHSYDHTTPSSEKTTPQHTTTAIQVKWSKKRSLGSPVPSYSTTPLHLHVRVLLCFRPVNKSRACETCRCPNHALCRSHLSQL